MKSALVSILPLALASIEEGACPSDFNYNRVPFDKHAITGLWYDYVFEAPYSDHLQYTCGMWTLLEDGDKMIAFNHLHYAEQDGKFAQLDLKWDEGGKPAATYNRAAAHHPEQAEGKQDKVMHITHTNYYSYAVGKSCQEFDNGTHEIAHFVWVREKQPAMYMRNEVRDYLLSEGVEISDLVKAPLVTCWGKDIY